MSTITKVVQQKNKNRANLYLDGKFAFGVSLEAIFKYGLKQGKTLSWEEIANLRSKGSEEKIYASAVNFATVRPRSGKEIVDWFKRKGVDKEVSEKVFNQLKRLDLVDDKSFAKWWVESRTSFKFYSRKLLKFELKQKGVDQKIIDLVLEETDVPSEIQLAKQALRKKVRDRVDFSEDDKRRLCGFLGRRGFSWSTIKRAVDEVFTKE
ncbi:MAG: RecX family transcriptional regulator [Candidatus Blackburnbacteria bacterium]|nr:RecX family transcriptional regulator [Candidatus Blackburnbacteria bacterium]